MKKLLLTLFQRVKKAKPELSSLYRSIVLIFAAIGFFTTVDWVWSHYVFGFHRNTDYAEDILVIHSTDTVANFRKVPVGEIKVDLVTGELFITSDKKRLRQDLPAHSTIQWTAYHDDGSYVGSTVVYYAEKKKRWNR